MEAEAETVLVVEDEAVTALDIQQSLLNKGFKVPEIASSGEEAIEKARRIRPDVVLMDIRLAGAMDGIEAARFIRTELNVAVVFLTAYADSATLERAKAAEPCAYVLKPFEETVLATTIEIASNKHRAHQTLVREATAALELSEERFRNLAENISGYAVQVLDPRGLILSWNPASEQMHGWGADRTLGKFVEVLYPHEEIQQGKPEQDVADAAKAGRLSQYQRLVRADGMRFSAEVILIALRNRLDGLAGFLRVARFIPEGGNDN